MFNLKLGFLTIDESQEKNVHLDFVTNRMENYCSIYENQSYYIDSHIIELFANLNSFSQVSKSEHFTR